MRPPAEFAPSLAQRIFVAGVAVAIGLLGLFMLVVAIGSFWVSPWLGAFMTGIAAIVAGLFLLVAKEAAGRFRLRVAVTDDAAILSLPRRRGFIDAAAVSRTVPHEALQSIETRAEFFRGLGVTTSQQSYVLCLKNGERLFLGADRAMLPVFFGRVADAISMRSRAPLLDRGAVDGDAGFLLVAGQSVPGWDAAPLAADEVALRGRRAGRTIWIMLALAMLVLLARLFAGD